MSIDESTRARAELVGAVLIRAFWLGVGVLLLWFALILALGDLAFRIHSSMFDITKQQFVLLNYAGMGLLKLFVFCVFLIPYIAIRLALKSAAQS